MSRILIVEDDPDILDIVSFNLAKEGYQAVAVTDGQKALKAFDAQSFDLVLLDIMLPKLDGLNVLDSIRAHSDVPVIIMSAKTAEDDRLEGLSRMADDYICKPFSVRELVMRVKVHLARYGQKIGNPTVTWGELELDEKNLTARRREEVLPLSKKEFQLLLLFAKNRGKTFTRDDLMERVWGYLPATADDRTVDVAVRRLREKIERDPSEPLYIISKRGIGYTGGMPQ